MDYSQKSSPRWRTALIARDRQGRRCADCGAAGQTLRTRRKLVEGRRLTEWICAAGCGAVPLTGAELERAVLAIAVADPSLVKTEAATGEPAAPRRGRGRPKLYEPISAYAQARRRVVERLGGQPSKVAIRAALGLSNGSFFRYEQQLEEARRNATSNAYAGITSGQSRTLAD